MKYCKTCDGNFLEGMIVDGKCPKGHTDLSDITTVTPLGIMMDEMSIQARDLKLKDLTKPKE